LGERNLNPAANEKSENAPFIKKHLSEKISNISLVNEFDSFAD